MSTMKHQSMEAVEEAQAAYWAVIRQHFPDVTLEDRSPEDEITFYADCQLAVVDALENCEQRKHVIGSTFDSQ